MKDFTEKCEYCKGRGGDAFGPCTDCYGQGEIPDHAAKLDAYDKREPLVLEVIAAYLSLEPSWRTVSGDGKSLLECLRRLAEWKP